MSDKEKLISILEKVDNSNSIEDILYYFIIMNSEDFSAERIYNIINKLNSDFLISKIYELERIKSIAKERSNYLYAYLDGKLYTTKEAAVDHIDIQKENAKAILEACDGLVDNI